MDDDDRDFKVLFPGQQMELFYLTVRAEKLADQLEEWGYGLGATQVRAIRDQIHQDRLKLVERWERLRRDSARQG